MADARRVHVALALACGLTISPLAVAQAPPPAAADAGERAGDLRNLVVLRVLAGEPSQSDESALLDATLRELLTRLGLLLATTRTTRAESLDGAPPPPSSAVALVTVDLAAPTRVVVRVVDPRTGEVVAMREVARDRSSAIVIDEVAHIVHGTVEELAEVRARRKPPPPDPTPPAALVLEPPATSPSRPSPERRSSSSRTGAAVDVGAFAVARAFGEGVAMGGGALASVGFARERRGPALWLSGAYHAPFDARGTLVDARIKVLATRAGATLELVGGAKFRVELGPQAGVDVTWTSAESTAVPASRLLPSSTEVAPVVGAAALARFAVAPTADVFLAVLADVDLAPSRYVVRRGTSTEAVFEPWRVRPALAFGFTFDLVGPPLYADAGGSSR